MNNKEIMSVQSNIFREYAMNDRYGDSAIEKLIIETNVPEQIRHILGSISIEAYKNDAEKFDAKIMGIIDNNIEIGV